MANINFTKEEDELIALIEDSVIAGKNKMDIIDNLDDKFADVKATRFDYLYSIAKCRAMYKNSSEYCYKKNSKSFADHNKSKKEVAIELNHQGKSIPEIAKELEVEVHTVEYYLGCKKEVEKAKAVSRKQKVLELTKQGMGKNDIAKKLDIKEHTVNCYITMLRKEGKLPAYVRNKKMPEGCPQDNYSDEIIPFDELIKPATSDFKADEIKADKSIVKHAKCVQEGENSVKHPGYYNTEHYECWSVWKEIVDAYNIPPVQAALLFNVLKYVWRYAVKGTPIQDLNKAANYIEELIREVEE